jgi:riboflavin kinase / FMN adenylyltransferase
MQAHFGSGNLQPQWEGSVVAMGVFDGIHLGHQALIRRAMELAREADHPCVVVTFDRHPASVLAPHASPLPLATLSQNLNWLAELGVDQTVVLPFGLELAAMEAEEFFDSYLSRLLRCRTMVAGKDFAFGRGRRGTLAWLESRVKVEPAPEVELRGQRVSSSSIRLAVSEGRVADASELLSRPFALEGVVVGGQKLGRTLGFPTVNLSLTHPQIIPSDGVYGGWAQTPHGRFRAAMSIGMRPTVGGSSRTIEAFLLDYPGMSLYGRTVTLSFLVRLRGEETYSSLDALKEQMKLDTEACRALR